MARPSLTKTHASSPSDDDHHARKRVCKACDRCRLKKSKCDGASPCSRCQLDNAICVFTERKRAHDKQYPKGYVEMLESQQQQLVAGLQMLYGMAVSGGSWAGSPLETSAHGGHPLTHDILESLGLLKAGDSHDHDGFEEDFEVMQAKLVHDGAEVMAHHSDEESSEHHHSPPGLQAHSMSPRGSQTYSFSEENSGPATPPELQHPMAPAQLQQQFTSLSNMDSANGMATFNAMRLQRQSWPQSMPAFSNDELDFLYKPNMTFNPSAMNSLGVFDETLMGGIQAGFGAEMDLDLYLQ